MKSQLPKILCYTGSFDIARYLIELAQDISDIAECQFAKQAAVSTPGSLISFASQHRVDYDLLILLLEPKETEVLLPQLLREAGVYMPMLVCLSDVRQIPELRSALRAQFLLAGADACLHPETVTFEELSATARALLRRHQGHVLPVSQNPNLFEIEGGLVFDLEKKSLYRKLDRHPIYLGRTEGRFLSILIEAGGEVVTYAELESKLHPGQPPRENLRFDSFVYRIRLKIAGTRKVDPTGVTFIKTIRGVGYCLVSNT